jgi:hypothetical protein
MPPTSLGMSRGIPGYPGGSPRGSAEEAGPVPPRPLRAQPPIKVVGTATRPSLQVLRPSVLPDSAFGLHRPVALAALFFPR